MAKFYSSYEIADSLCLRSNDILRRKKGVYLECSSDVWDDLNEGVLKMATRIKEPLRRGVKINKRTNSLDLPCNIKRLCSVDVRDDWGNFYPIYRNQSITDDIVDVGNGDDCSCEHNCNYKLCNTIKGYEAIQTVKHDSLPDGTPISFNCVERKYADVGVVYYEHQYPLRVYMSGVWTDTILHTETTKLCECETDENGCICDTHNNIETVCNSCGIGNVSTFIAIGGNANKSPDPKQDRWIYYCNNKMDWFSVQCGGFPRWFSRNGCNIYNISELGNRLIFPPNFGWDHVIIRYYEDIELSDIKVPYLAKEAFMAGLQYFSTINREDKIKEAAVFEQRYSKRKKGLFLELNKYRIAELGQIFAAPSYIPSYISHREDDYLNNGVGIFF